MPKPSLSNALQNLKTVSRRDRPAKMEPRFAIAPVIMNVALSPILVHLKQELTDVYGDRLLHLTSPSSAPKLVATLTLGRTLMCW